MFVLVIYIYGKDIEKCTNEADDGDNDRNVSVTDFAVYVTGLPATENHGSPGQVTDRSSKQDQLDSSMNYIDSFDFDATMRFISPDAIDMLTSVLDDNSSGVLLVTVDALN